MIRSFSEIEGLPVVNMRDGSEIAKVSHFLFDYARARIVAVFVNTPSFLEWGKKEKLVLAEDVVEWGGGLYVQNAQSLIEVKEVVRIEKMMENYFPLLGMKVVTESKKYLGRVEDFLFHDQIMELEKILVVRRMFWFWESRALIHVKQIKKMSMSTITIKDDATKLVGAVTA